MDTSVMERIFSSDRTLGSLPTASEELDEEGQERISLILTHMSRISPVEADMLELHILKKVPQSIIGKIFGYTQPNVHYRISRGISRLKVFLTIPIFTEEEIELMLKGYFTDPKDILVVKMIYLYSSQSLVAREISESQGKVRYRFLRCLKSLSHSEELKDLYSALVIINDNLTLLRKGKDEETRRVIL